MSKGITVLLACYINSMLQKIRAILFKPGTLLVVFVAAAIIASVQGILLGTHMFHMPKVFPADIMNKPEYMNQFIGRQLTEYNNYVIFKYSWFHLIHGTDLYGLYPAEHWDFYKYSPTFALFMGGIAYLPDVIGLSIWNILNAIAVFFAIRLLPFSVRKQCLILWFVALELLTCLQNNQSNGLMCGLIIAAYGCMEHKKVVLATLWLVLAMYIKVYGAIGFCFFLFYPGKFKFILYSILWTVVFAALPLLVTSPQTLVWQYQNWANLMIADAAAARGLSVAGWLYSWFGIENVKMYVTLIGMGLFLLPFVRFKMYSNQVFRLLVLASMLVWVIIFNHKAESSTFIIAVAGVAIWYFAMPSAKWRTVLFWLVFVFTCLATTDVFPMYVKTHFIYVYKIKAVPCIIVWCMILADVMRLSQSARIPAEKKDEFGLAA